MLIYFRHGDMLLDNRILSFDIKYQKSDMDIINKASIYLKSYKPINILYSCPNITAVKTSNILGELLDIHPEVLECLREIACNKTSFKYSRREMFDKASSALYSIMQSAKDDNVLIVGNHNLFSMWICSVSHTDPFNLWVRNVVEYNHPFYTVNKYSINTIINKNGTYKIGLLNYTGYNIDRLSAQITP